MDSKGLQELTDIYLKEISADTALAASKKADVERGKAAAGGDREKAKAKAAQASRLYKASAEKRKKEPVAIADRSYPKGKGASYQEDKDWGYDEDGNSLNPVDIEKRKKEDDDLAGAPNKKGKKKAKKDFDGDGELESPEDEYKGSKDKAIKKAMKKEDVEVVERLIESGKFSTEEIANIVDLQEADIADILARLEKKRISKGGDPEESPLPAMKKYHADKKKKKVKEDYWNEFEEGYQRNPEKGEEEERKRSQRVRGERTPMPPRGDKKREEFERWYAANVR